MAGLSLMASILTGITCGFTRAEPCDLFPFPVLEGAEPPPKEAHGQIILSFLPEDEYWTAELNVTDSDSVCVVKLLDKITSDGIEEESIVTKGKDGKQNESCHPPLFHRNSWTDVLLAVEQEAGAGNPSTGNQSSENLSGFLTLVLAQSAERKVIRVTDCPLRSNSFTLNWTTSYRISFTVDCQHKECAAGHRIASSSNATAFYYRSKFPSDIVRVTLTIFAAGNAMEESFEESWHVDESYQVNEWHKISFRRFLRGLEMILPGKPPRTIRNTSAIFPDFCITEVIVDGNGVVTWCTPDESQPSAQCKLQIAMNMVRQCAAGHRIASSSNATAFYYRSKFPSDIVRVTLTIFAAGNAMEESFEESWHVDESYQVNEWHKISFRRFLRGLEMILPGKPPRTIRNTSAIFPDFCITEVIVDGNGVVTWCTPDESQPSAQYMAMVLSAVLSFAAANAVCLCGRLRRKWRSRDANGKNYVVRYRRSRSCSEESSHYMPAPSLPLSSPPPLPHTYPPPLPLKDPPPLPLEDLPPLPLRGPPPMPLKDPPLLPLEDAPPLPLEDPPPLPLEDPPLLSHKVLPPPPLKVLPPLPLKVQLPLPLKDPPQLPLEDAPPLPIENVPLLSHKVLPPPPLKVLPPLPLKVQLPLPLKDPPPLPLEDAPPLPLEDPPPLLLEDPPLLSHKVLPPPPLKVLPPLPLKVQFPLPLKDPHPLPLEDAPPLPLEDAPPLPLEDAPPLPLEDAPPLPLEDPPLLSHKVLPPLPLKVPLPLPLKRPPPLPLPPPLA
ncbi:uncharacterized protein LOC134779979 [Penaeus indicus]|uniref:uncharacterized protein LOC134779979 n=1 Tax=Penaeus indicus TaxID=29960 RepID=UPI00300D5454